MTTSTSKLSIITGPMFAGKTTRILDIYRRDTEGTLIVKPALDKRYNGHYKVTSHDGYDAPCKPLRVPKDLFLNITPEVKHVVMDECQFFDPYELTKTVRDAMGYYQVDVTCVGLDRDFKGNDYKYLSELGLYANKIDILYGSCNCGNSSMYTIRKKEFEQNSLMLVGGPEMYDAVCGECFKQHKKYVLGE